MQDSNTALEEKCKNQDAFLPLALLHLIHSFWKVLIQGLWEEEVDHGGGHGQAPHEDVGQDLIVGTCGVGIEPLGLVGVAAVPETHLPLTTFIPR